MANTYDVGDLVRVTATFTNSAGAVQDPTVVIAKYKDPSGNQTTLTYGTDVALKKASTGLYYVDVSIDEIGNWYYLWQATGVGQAAGEGWFQVNEFRTSWT